MRVTQWRKSNIHHRIFWCGFIGWVECRLKWFFYFFMGWGGFWVNLYPPYLKYAETSKLANYGGFSGKGPGICVFLFLIASYWTKKKNSPLKTIVYWLWRGKNQKPETKKNPKVVGFIFFLALLKKPKKKTHHSGAFPEYPLYVDTFWRYKHYFKTSENVWTNQRQTQRPKLQWSK